MRSHQRAMLLLAYEPKRCEPTQYRHRSYRVFTERSVILLRGLQIHPKDCVLLPNAVEQGVCVGCFAVVERLRVLRAERFIDGEAYGVGDLYILQHSRTSETKGQRTMEFYFSTHEPEHTANYPKYRVRLYRSSREMSQPSKRDS